MVKKEICLFCQNSIDTLSERFVIIGTYEKEKTLEEEYFHIKCFKKNWDSKIQEGIMKRINAGMQGANQLLNQLKQNG